MGPACDHDPVRESDHARQLFARRKSHLRAVVQPKASSVSVRILVELSHDTTLGECLVDNPLGLAGAWAGAIAGRTTILVVLLPSVRSAGIVAIRRGRLILGFSAASLRRLALDEIDCQSQHGRTGEGCYG